MTLPRHAVDYEVIRLNEQTESIFVQWLESEWCYYHGGRHIEIKKDKKCVAFNTLGFFKNKADVNTLKPSQYFGEEDGIYIKKEYYKANETIKIKMLCN